MKPNERHKMGRFSVDVEIANYADVVEAERGHLDPAKVRRKTVRGVVDNGASRLVLPQALAKELGLPLKKKKVRVRYADGRRALRREASAIQLHLLGRDGLITAVMAPKHDTTP